jgi:hypothetical protein
MVLGMALNCINFSPSALILLNKQDALQVIPVLVIRDELRYFLEVPQIPSSSMQQSQIKSHPTLSTLKPPTMVQSSSGTLPSS